MPKQKLGEVLQERGKISREVLERAIEEQTGKEILLGEILLKSGLVTKAELVRSLEEVSKVPYLDANSAVVDAEALRLVPYSLAKRYCALPLRCEGKKLQVLMEKPHDLAALQHLEFATGYSIETRFGFREEITAAIDKFYEEGRRGSDGYQWQRIDDRVCHGRFQRAPRRKYPGISGRVAQSAHSRGPGRFDHDSRGRAAKGQRHSYRPTGRRIHRPHPHRWDTE